MKDKMPEIHDAIVNADIKSRERFSGHGSAIAQVYNHMILPLANARDKNTQVIWASAILNTASAASRKACGFPKRRLIMKHWKHSPTMDQIYDPFTLPSGARPALE